MWEIEVNVEPKNRPILAYHCSHPSIVTIGHEFDEYGRGNLQSIGSQLIIQS
jgi:hypothetical protein